EEAAQTERATLSVADTAAQEETEKEAEELTAEETEAETEEETEEAAEESAGSSETLETTATGDDGIVAMDVSGIVENCMPSIVAITNVSVEEVESYF